MSRSAPSVEVRNPVERWLEWNAQRGIISYYDRETKQKVEIGDKLTLYVLDVGRRCVKGWDAKSESGIYSREVVGKMMRTAPFVVSSFKGGEIARGLWRDIKGIVKEAGGKLCSNTYAAMEVDDGRVALVCLQLHGTASVDFSDFVKAKGEKAVAEDDHVLEIIGSETDKSGSVTFRRPKFKLSPGDPEMLAAATKLDREVLQPYFAAYAAHALAEPIGKEESGITAEFGDELGPETVVQIPGGEDDFAPGGQPRF